MLEHAEWKRVPPKKSRGMLFPEGQEGRSRSLTVGCTCQMAFGHLAGCSPSSPPNTTDVEAQRFTFPVPRPKDSIVDARRQLVTGCRKLGFLPSGCSPSACIRWMFCVSVLRPFATLPESQEPTERSPKGDGRHVSQVQSSQSRAHEVPNSMGTSSKGPTLHHKPSSNELQQNVTGLDSSCS